MTSDPYDRAIDDRAPTHARLMDGKLLLVTNTPDLSPEEVLKRNKSLPDIKRGFRVLKSEIEIGPIYHRLPNRIRAHAAICFMALILYRVMVNDTQPVAGLSTINLEHTAILAALTIKKPSLNTQLTTLVVARLMCSPI